MSEVPLYGEGGDVEASSARATSAYRGASLAKKRTPLGPYRRPIPRVLGRS